MTGSKGKHTMGKLFYIMGKSASGKDHIYTALLSQEHLSLKRLVLYTTRPQRDGEEEGREKRREGEEWAV